MSFLSSIFGSSKKQLAVQLYAQQQAEAAQAQQAELQAQIVKAQQSASTELAKQTQIASDAQRAAEEASARAAQTPADSEDARQAMDQRMKRLLGKRGLSSFLGGSPLGAAKTAASVLTGA